MPLVESSQGSIAPIQPGSGGQGTSPVSPQQASNPGRINRDSIHQVEPELRLSSVSQKGQSLETSSLSNRSIESVSPDEVEKKLPSSSDKLQSAANELRESISTEGSKSRAPIDRSSQQALSRQIGQAKQSLSQAKQLQSQAHGLANDGNVQKNLLASGLGGRELTLPEQHATWAANEADVLVSTRKQEVKDLEKALKDLKTEEKQTAKAGKKAHKSLEGLQKEASSLGRGVARIRSKVVAAPDSSSKKLGEELKSLNSALKKANSVVSDGEKLLRSADAKHRKHSIDVSGVEKRVSLHISEAKAEAGRLRVEIAQLKKTIGVAKGEEAKARKAAKKEAQRV